MGVQNCLLHRAFTAVLDTSGEFFTISCVAAHKPKRPSNHTNKHSREGVHLV